MTNTRCKHEQQTNDKMMLLIGRVGTQQREIERERKKTHEGGGGGKDKRSYRRRKEMVSSVLWQSQSCQMASERGEPVLEWAHEGTGGLGTQASWVCQ